MSELPNRPFDRRLPAWLAAVGLLCAAALESVHFRAYADPSASSFCSAGPHLDCTTVALSRWSVVWGVPLPMWGIAGFLALGLLAWWRSRWLVPLSALAALSSLGLLAIELLAIHSVCLLCEGVHLASFGLLLVAWRGRSSLTDTDGMLLVHLFTVPVGLLVFAHALLVPYWAVFSWKNGVTFPHGTDANGYAWIGAEQPKIVLHEYTDYACPHCTVATNQIRRLLAEHPSTLRVVHHNYPRMRCSASMGATACLYARAANCAGDQGKFWEMDSWLFEHVPGKLPSSFEGAVADLGLDSRRFSTCVENHAAFERADAEVVAASKADVSETPSYLIDGQKYVGGDVLRPLRARL